MSFPKMGKWFPGGTGGSGSTGPRIAAEIAAALRRELGDSHAAVKTAARWTGASERTAKNWLSGRYAPSGEHLVALAHYSGEVLLAFLILAGRDDVAAASAALGVRDRLREIVDALDGLAKGPDLPPR
ncbi:MAG: hypothetical protein PGN33_01565 [Methylobacterium radiotolerans]